MYKGLEEIRRKSGNTFQRLQELRDVHSGWSREVKGKKEWEKGLEVYGPQWVK